MRQTYPMSKAKPVSDRVQVPLKPKALAALSKRAKANDRPLGREAAAILTSILLESK